MFNYKKIIRLKLILVFIFFPNIIFADNHNINEILDLIQKDLKTLEKAVYSGSNNSNSQKSTNENSEDVLTRHLLKLSDVEKQFQELTNKFEEINFKLDKLGFLRFRQITKSGFKMLKMSCHLERLEKN
jgi:hypothetical protein